MNNNHFSWIQFYKEVAEKLLAYKTDRINLLSWIYQSLDSRFTSYLHEASGDLLSDIDPFTVLGIFNRKIKAENRIEIAKQFKDFLQIASETPKDFDGIPVLNPLNSFFFAFEDKRNSNDIENLWELFEQVLNNESGIEATFDLVRKQSQINIKITMGLYWISPERFIALDRNNRNYLAQYGLNLPPKVPTFSDYMKIIEEIRQKMNDGKIVEKSFPEISNAAWGAENDVVEGESDDKSWYSEVLKVWKYKKNIILQGAPGTGKTYEIPELVVRLCDCTLQHTDRENVIRAYKQLVEENRVVFTTFHQSMDYEDFIEGIKPEVSDGSVNYIVNDGLFKSLCERAQASYDVKPHSEEKKDEEPYILVIDEINRGNVSKIFGELITLLEADKRAGEESEIKVRLPYSKSGFKVPNNVYVIATMNTADRSVGGLDYAIRRRFAFIPLYPCLLDNPGFNEELFRKVSELFVSNYDAIMQDYHIRPVASDYLSEEFEPADVWIGQSYFIMQDKNGIDQTFNRLQYEVIPILREYIRDGVFKDTETIEQVIMELENDSYDD